MGVGSNIIVRGPHASISVNLARSGNGCDLASTLCTYDFRKDDLFFYELDKGTSEAGKYLFRARMCGGGVRNILLLPLGPICLETIDVCIWHMLVFMYVTVTVDGSVEMFVM